MFEASVNEFNYNTPGISSDDLPLTMGESFDAALSMYRDVESPYALDFSFDDRVEERGNQIWEDLKQDPAFADTDAGPFLGASPSNYRLLKDAYNNQDQKLINQINATGLKQQYRNYSLMQDQIKINGTKYKTDDQLYDETLTEARSIYNERSTELARSDNFWSELGGSAVGAFHNPLVALSMLTGGEMFVAAGVSRLANTLRFALGEGFVGAGAEALGQPKVFENMEKLGINYGFEEASKNIAAAGIGGAVFGGLIKGGMETGGALLSRLKNQQSALNKDIENGLELHSAEIETANNLADEIIAVTEDVVARHGDNVPTSVVREEMASYWLRKQQFEDFVINGDTNFDVARMEYIRELSQVAETRLLNSEVKQLQAEVKRLRKPAEVDPTTIPKEELTARQKKKAEKLGAAEKVSKGQEAAAAKKAKEIDAENAARILEIETQLKNNEAAVEARADIERAKQNIVPERVLKRALDVAYMRESYVDYQPREGVYPASPIKRVEVAYKAPEKAPEVDIETKPIDPEDMTNSTLYNDILEQRQIELDKDLFTRTSNIVKDVDPDVPTGYKLNDAGESVMTTGKASDVLAKAEAKVKGIEAVQMCMRGGA